MNTGRTASCQTVQFRSVATIVKNYKEWHRKSSCMSIACTIQQNGICLIYSTNLNRILTEKPNPAGTAVL